MDLRYLLFLRSKFFDFGLNSLHLLTALHTQILCLTLRRTLHHQMVRILKPAHQMVLLENSWGGLFLLNMTQWLPDLGQTCSFCDTGQVELVSRLVDTFKI